MWVRLSNTIKLTNTALQGVSVKNTENLVVSSDDHNMLINRDSPNQHSISAITGLKEELDSLNKVFDTKADKQNSEGGFAGGSSSFCEYGGAIGLSAKSYSGGAVGNQAKTANGFAGGAYAITMDYDDELIDAVQLGTGTNRNEKTLQVYDYTLMDASGKIPNERLSDEIVNGSGGGNGVTFTPSVSEDGVISWTNDGNLENPTPTNIKGAKGDKGERGSSGVYVGSGDMPADCNVQIDPNGVTIEVDDLKGDLANVKNATVTEKKSTNLYNEENAKVGYRCDNNGYELVKDGSILSDFIEIPGGVTYAVPCVFYNNKYRTLCYSYGFADKNRTPIGGRGGVAFSAISIPDGAKFFRCSWMVEETSQRFINFNTDGSLFPYEEYYKTIYSPKTSEDVINKLNECDERITSLEELNDEPEVKRVVCWGDSLTDGAGASDTKHQYPYILKSLINTNNTGIETDSAGQGGEGTYNIATRQGGVVVNVKPCTIPESGSVNVEIDKWNGLTISLCRRGGNDVTTDNAKMKINPCYIAGVKGTLLRDSNSNYVFTRTEDGEEVTFTRPMPLLTNGHETYNGKNEVGVIWSGTNDIDSNGGTIEKTIQGINMMIAELKSKKYIVVGLTSKAYHSDIDDKNFRMATEYKDHFVNVRDYMLTYGLEDSGIEPTEQDLTDISNGEIPSSLRVDDVHGNDYFYDVVAKQVYKKGQELGYWN